MLAKGRKIYFGNEKLHNPQPLVYEQQGRCLFMSNLSSYTLKWSFLNVTCLILMDIATLHNTGSFIGKTDLAKCSISMQAKLSWKWLEDLKKKNLSLKPNINVYMAFTIRPQRAFRLKLTGSSKTCVSVSILVHSVWKTQRQHPKLMSEQLKVGHGASVLHVKENYYSTLQLHCAFEHLSS